MGYLMVNEMVAKMDNLLAAVKVEYLVEMTERLMVVLKDNL